MPEGDTIELAARRLRPLVGQPLEIETPHPRHGHDRIPERLRGATVARLEARGKHLLVTFSNALTLHVHLRMSGRLDVHPLGGPWGRARSRAWLVLRAGGHEAILFDGPVMELLTPGELSLHPVLRRLGPDLLDDGFDVAVGMRALRSLHPATAIAVALLDQRALAGIGNVWRSELLFACRLDPLRPLAALDDAELEALVRSASAAMRGHVERGGRRPTRIYGRSGRPCPRCGRPISSRLLGDEGRRLFWCPRCQASPT